MFGSHKSNAMKFARIILPLFTLLISGCVSVPPPKPLNVVGLEKSSQVSVIDLRPASENENKCFSFMVTSEAYAIYRFPELTTSPNRLRILSHRAYETLPGLASAPTLKVHHFVAYVNMKSELRRSSIAGGLGGAIGGAIMAASSSSPKDGQIVTATIDPSIFAQTEEDEHRRAFYSTQENPSKTSVNVIYIDTEILGQRIATRSLMPRIISDHPMSVAEMFDKCITDHLAYYKASQPAQIPASQVIAKDVTP